MKAITLWEPWASLVAKGHKKVETRSWKTNYRGPLAIHASAKIPSFVRTICRPFARLLGIKKYDGSWLYYLEHGIGPFGKVVATCNLTACYKVQAYRSVVSDRGQFVPTAFLDAGNRLIKITGPELEFGDYTVGRYAWILEDIKPLVEPMPAKGKQGLWNWEQGE